MEKQERLEARARFDIKKLYDRGEITLKNHTSAIGYPCLTSFVH